VLTTSSAVRIFVARDPCDMRKSFDGLCALTRDVLQQDPYSGHYFVFVNRRANMLKLLMWDRTGFCLFYKRLEEGTFKIREMADREVSHPQLLLMLEGLELRGAKQRKRFSWNNR
jgi:transposase